MLQLLHKAYSLNTLAPPPIARYCFIQLSELGRCGENEIAQASKWQQNRVEPGLP